MSRLTTLKKVLTDRDYRTIRLAKAGFYDHLDDRTYLEKLYRAKLGRPLNLEDPQLFSEKLQWLKLYDRNPLYTQLVDKYQVRAYIAEKIGEEYLIPLLGVWDDPDEIDFDALPDQFVLKCNHNSGTGMCICRDKSKLDIEKVKAELRKGLAENFFLKAREWPYKDVPRKIVCEQYMSDQYGADGLTDYKFFCFDGYVESVMLCVDRHLDDVKFYFFGQDWKIRKYNKRSAETPDDFTLPKPTHMDEMFAIASSLSEGISFVRVDLYESNGRIYFGEMTLYPTGGYDSDLLPGTDKYFGSILSINEKGV